MLSGEVPAAPDWVRTALAAFNHVNVYLPRDGSFHEGVGYWSSYIGRFTWWADVMEKALGLDAYQKPYFSMSGYFPLYLMPPGQAGGGFGDLAPSRRSADAVLEQLLAHLLEGRQQPPQDVVVVLPKPVGFVAHPLQQ